MIQFPSDLSSLVDFVPPAVIFILKYLRTPPLSSEPILVVRDSGTIQGWVRPPQSRTASVNARYSTFPRHFAASGATRFPFKEIGCCCWLLYCPHLKMGPPLVPFIYCSLCRGRGILFSDGSANKLSLIGIFPLGGVIEQSTDALSPYSLDFGAFFFFVGIYCWNPRPS